MCLQADTNVEHL